MVEPLPLSPPTLVIEQQSEYWSQVLIYLGDHLTDDEGLTREIKSRAAWVCASRTYSVNFRPAARSLDRMLNAEGLGALLYRGRYLVTTESVSYRMNH